MFKSMMTRVLLFLWATWTVGMSHAQAVSPATTTGPTSVSIGPNFHIPLGTGTVEYSLTASDTGEKGDALTGGHGWYDMATAGWDLTYTANSMTHPFSMLYSGGYYWTNLPDMPSTTFHMLTISQGLVRPRWGVGFSDSITYMPMLPAFGLSGIPGLGDIGVQAGPSGPGLAPTALTTYMIMVMDTASVAGSYSLDRRDRLSIQGGTSWMHFPGNTVLDSLESDGTISFDRRLSTKSTAGVSYTYSAFNYLNISLFNFTTQTATVYLQRKWGRYMNINLSVGPQWITGQDTKLFPTQTDIEANASLAYSKKTWSANFEYSRGAMTGYGLLPGAFENSYAGTYEHKLGRNWDLSFTGTYMQFYGYGGSFYGPTTPSSNNTGNVDTEYGAIQVTRKLGKDFSTYVSYAGENQSYPGTMTLHNALNGFGQMVSGGVTFSPRSHHLGQL
jgi:hypothetical protein